MRLYPNGAGEALGDAVASTGPLYATGDVWFVHSATGTDGVSPAGLNREKPLATLGQAITNAAAYDIIILIDGHAETISSTITISKALTIAAGGASSGKPTVKLTPQLSSGAMFSITADGVSLRNIWFVESAEESGSPKINVAASHFEMAGCYCPAGALDTNPIVNIDATAASVANIRFANSTFISTATSTGAQPASGINATTTGYAYALNYLSIDGVTFSDGTVGWSDFYAMDLNALAVINARIQNISLLLGADIRIAYNHSTTISSGFVVTPTVDGGSRVLWSF